MNARRPNPTFNHLKMLEVMLTATPLFAPAASENYLHPMPAESRNRVSEPNFQISHSLAPAKKKEKHPAETSGKIAFPTVDGLTFEKVKQITFLEASGNYTMLHFLDGRQVLVAKTLGDVEAMLPTVSFVRIHRSHTVNLKHLKKYVRGKGGQVILQNGVTLTVSAGQKDFFLEAVKGFFGA